MPLNLDTPCDAEEFVPRSTKAIDERPALLVTHSAESAHVAIAKFRDQVKRRIGRYVRVVATVFGSMISTVAAVALLRLAHFPHSEAVAVSVQFWGLLLSGAYGAFGILRPAKFYSGAEIREFASAAGVNAIGPLIDARLIAMKWIDMPELYDTLTDLLPRLTKVDASCLEKTHRDFLYEVMESVGQIGLSAKQHDAMRIAAIDGMTRVGDARALQIIRRLAHPTMWPHKIGEVEAAALAALPILRRRLDVAALNSTLLRASAPLPAGPENLLCAAVCSAPGETDRLLRASEVPD